MASALLRTSFRRGSAFRRVVSAAPTPMPAPSGGEGLTVRRAVSLPPSSIRRTMCSGALGDKPPMSPEEKIIQQVEEILAKKSMPQDVVKDIALSAMEIRREARNKELSREGS
ncbi:unnamed protein product [Urochloa decumbens]|uniref:Uncharacterized protein n=1 Tax=Urochloa decumbens TaxID=240449 RepID=A0ABC8YIT3_9POAL